MNYAERPPAAGLAVVTGASTGIGLALAAELADRGYDLVVVADEPEIDAAARKIARSGRSVTPVQADLATVGGVEQLLQRLTARELPVDVAALNAGIGVNGRFDQTSLADHLRLIDLNVRSTVHLAHGLLARMVAAGQGRVLVTSSVAAVSPGPYQSTYAASKAFVHSFAEAVRHELKDTGVTVTSLMPGPTDTDFFARAHMDESTPLGRSDHKDDPREVARDAVDGLLKGKSSVVTGSFMNRVQAELGTHLPDALSAPILARMVKPD
jgi:short-subunit dehydrogenase